MTWGEQKRTDGKGKTFGIWGFVSLFVLLAAAGLAALLLIGSPNTPTEPVTGDLTPNTSLTTTSLTTTSLLEAAAPSGEVSNTLPGGAAAPEGVSQVLSSPGSLSFAFQVPPEFSVSQAQTAVAPVRTRTSPQESSITAVISCAVSSEEVLAQVSVSETSQSVTLAAVVLVPPNAPPCSAAAVPREVTLPLAAPLGQRTVLVVPPGTEVPQPNSPS
ncbi:MAG: hypothetical protein WCJ04_00245 [Actinomycetes bacterium]